MPPVCPFRSPHLRHAAPGVSPRAINVPPLRGSGRTSPAPLHPRLPRLPPITDHRSLGTRPFHPPLPISRPTPLLGRTLPSSKYHEIKIAPRSPSFPPPTPLPS